MPAAWSASRAFCRARSAIWTASAKRAASAYAAASRSRSDALLPPDSDAASLKRPGVAALEILEVIEALVPSAISSA